MVCLKERFAAGIDVGIDVSLLDDLPTDRAVYHDKQRLGKPRIVPCRDAFGEELCRMAIGDVASFPCS